MYEFISSVASATVPAPVAAAVGLFGLGAGLWWMRARTADVRRAAVRTASAASTYWVRAERARTYIKAVETPTQQIDVTELRAAYASRTERLRAKVADIAGQVREAVLPTPGEPDWAEGEMTAAFNKIVEDNEWEQPGAFADHTLPGNPSPWVSPIAASPAPAPSAPPAVVHAPRGPQTPPRWVDGGTPPPRRSQEHTLPARERRWSLMGPVPALSLPEFPRPFQMPTQRLRPTPALLAQLPEDPTRVYRTRTV